MREDVAGHAAPAPLGATLPGPAERKPSEIPSRTQSVSAFLLDKASVGPPLLRQRSLRALQHRHPLKMAPSSNTEGEWTKKATLVVAFFFSGGLCNPNSISIN